jgi:AraC family transcriptional regulator of arabinose operon
MLIAATPSPPAELLVTGHFREAYGYRVMRPHGSGNWLLTYTLSGQGEFRLGDVVIRATAGDAVLLAPTTLHDYRTPGEGGVWEFLWAHFQPRSTWQSWLHLPEIAPGLFSAHIANSEARERIRLAFMQTHLDARVRDLATLKQDAAGWDAAHTSSSAFPPLSTLEQEIALNGLERVLLLLAYASRQKPERPYDTRIHQVQEMIAHDLAAPHTLTSLADAVALSPSRLGHLFRANTGRSVMQTLNAMRLHQAARLLETTPDSIEQIAARVGFQSAFYFIRVFNQAFGMSPRI